MNINGGGRGNVGYWAGHLTNTEQNDRAELKDIRGLAAENLPDALREMQAVAAGSKSQGNFMYVADINPRSQERLTEAQWNEAIDTLENHLGLAGHQRVVIEHEKLGRVHRHVVWNRVDVETLRVKDIGGNFYSHERVARDLEIKFDLQREKSLHNERRPDGRPERAPELWEIRAAEKTGIDTKDIKAELTDLWRTTDSGKAFAAALDERGYILAQGDRRAFVVVDHAGTVHSLAKRIEDANTKEIRARFSDIDYASLPTAKEAKAMQDEKYPTPEQAREAWNNRAGAEPARQPERTPERPADPRPEFKFEQPQPGNAHGVGNAEWKHEKPEAKHPAYAHEPEKAATEKRVNTTVENIGFAWRQSPTVEAFAAAMKDEGYKLARVTPEEARNSERAAAFAKEIGSFAPKYRENEIVIINERGAVYRLNAKTTGADRDSIDQRLTGLDRDALPTMGDAKASQIADRQQQNAEHAKEQRETRWQQRDESKLEKRIGEIAKEAQRDGVPVGGKLYAEGITLARVDAKGKAEMDAEYRHQFDFEKAKGSDNTRIPKTAFKEGELVAVTKWGHVHRLNPRILDIEKLEREVTGGSDKTPTLSAAREHFATERQQQKDDRAAARETFKEAGQTQRGQDRAADGIKGATAEAAGDIKDVGLKVATGIGKGFVSFSSFLEGLFGMGSASANTSGQQQARRGGQSHEPDAIEAIWESMKRGEALMPADVRSLTHETLMNMRGRSDDFVRGMIDDMYAEQKKERERDYERER